VFVPREFELTSERDSVNWSTHVTLKTVINRLSNTDGQIVKTVDKLSLLPWYRLCMRSPPGFIQASDCNLPATDESVRSTAD